CFSRVRQRQSACCCREKIRRTPSGAGKISPSICVPPLPLHPRLVSRPLRQSGKRHQRRRAASSAAQPADPSKVTATSGSASNASAHPPLARGASPPDPLLWRPPRERSKMMINEARAASGTRRRPRGARRAGRAARSPLSAPQEGRGREGQRPRGEIKGPHFPPLAPRCPSTRRQGEDGLRSASRTFPRRSRRSRAPSSSTSLLKPQSPKRLCPHSPTSPRGAAGGGRRQLRPVLGRGAPRPGAGGSGARPRTRAAAARERTPRPAEEGESRSALPNATSPGVLWHRTRRERARASQPERPRTRAPHLAQQLRTLSASPGPRPPPLRGHRAAKSQPGKDRLGAACLSAKYWNRVGWGRGSRRSRPLAFLPARSQSGCKRLLRLSLCKQGWPARGAEFPFGFRPSLLNAQPSSVIYEAGASSTRTLRQRRRQTLPEHPPCWLLLTQHLGEKASSSCTQLTQPDPELPCSGKLQKHPSWLALQCW
ncbi:hypothetical protein J0S82_000130, partial [Galemys pyrenaicus]